MIMRINHRILFAGMTLAALSSSFLSAAPVTEADYTAGDIVLLQPAQGDTWLQATSDSDFHYTSNELLLPDSNLLPASDDGVFAETFGVAVTPPSINQLGSSLFAREQYIRYASQQQNDFDVSTVGFQLRRPVLDGFQAYGGTEQQWYRQIGNNNDFFRMYDTQAGIWRPSQICDNLSFDSGYQFDWRAAMPKDYSRIDNTLFVGLGTEILPRLNAALQYRLSLRDYLNNNRCDLNQLATLRLTYELATFAAVSAYASYGHNNSNHAVNDFDVFDGGAGLTLTVKF